MKQSHRVSPVRILIFLCAAALVVSASTFTMSAQSLLDGPTVWDGVFTEAQAERGAGGYASNCSQCHGADLRGGGRFAALVGDSWMGNFQTQTVRDLYDFISTNMPNGANAGSLSGQMYLDLAAFILSSNDMPAGEAELTADSGAGVVIVAEDGELLALPDATLVRVVGCLAEDDNGWVVNNATTPERLTSAGVGLEDATVALGDGSYPLLFVLLPIDEFIGHRVSVSGLSEGAGASDGINVTIVESVGETCQ
jgi:cytochrome c553